MKASQGFLACIVAALALTLSGAASAAEKVIFQLEFPYPTASHVGLRLAEVKGWYKDAGLDVEIRMGKGSALTVQQIAAGQADIGVSALSAMAPSVANGLPVTSVMAMARHTDLALIMGADTGYKSLQDLKGKKIASPSSGAPAVLLNSFLAKAGLKPTDVDIVFMDSGGVLSAFTSKSVDGVIYAGPYLLARVGDKRQGVPVYFSEVGLNLPSYGLITNVATIKAKPDMLRKVIAINQRAWEYVKNGHEQEGVDAVVKTGEQFRPDPVALLGELKLLLQLFDTPETKGHPVGWQSKADWEESLRVMESVQLIKAGWKADDYFTNQFIQEPPFATK